MKISDNPAPGLTNTKVDPIPTPARVPNPTDSLGLKYNSLLSLILEFSNFDWTLK